MAEKIKAIQPEIIVRGTVERPYYSILYYEISDKVWHIGYSSYNLENVAKWLQEYFEVVEETADIVEVVRCKDCTYRNTKACGAKHERTDMDFCSHGLRKVDDE